MDDETRLVHIEIGILEHIAVDIDLDQGRRRDLLVEESVGIDQELILGSRHSQGNMVIDQMGPAKMRRQAVSGGELDPRLPFLVAHLIPHRGDIECINRDRHVVHLPV